MKNNKEYKFKVGDKAELDLGFGFMKGDCMMYIERGAEVTVTKVFGEVCEVEYEGAVSLINSYYLTLIEPKDKPKFKEGDEVRCHALGGDEYFDGVVVSYNNEYGAKCYGVLNENTHTIANVDFEHCVELIDEQSKVEAKFKVGDTVKKSDSDLVYKILEIHLFRGKRPVYKIDDGFGWKGESELTLYVNPKDITEQIRTFEDARVWCYNNDKESLVVAYDEIYQSLGDMADMQDVFAFLKLRIITAALNEGWVPTFESDETRWFASSDTFSRYEEEFPDSPKCLAFRTSELAEYAAKQFKNLYIDFCHREER